MKLDGKYRYSLQFPDNTEEGRRVGELLERMGNRKSSLVVKALNEYLNNHPELLQKDCNIQVSMTSLASPDDIKQIVRELIEERISGWQTDMLMVGASTDTGAGKAESGEAADASQAQEEKLLEEMEADVSQMLNNLDFFQ